MATGSTKVSYGLKTAHRVVLSQGLSNLFYLQKTAATRNRNFIKVRALMCSLRITWAGSGTSLELSFIV